MHVRILPAVLSLLLLVACPHTKPSMVGPDGQDSPIVAWRKACAGGDAGACEKIVAGYVYSGRDDLLRESVEELKSGCTRGAPDACTGIELARTSKPPADEIATAMSKACAAGGYFACLYELPFAVQRVPEKEAKVALLQEAERGCMSGGGVKCAAAATLYASGTVSYGNPRVLLEKGCASLDPASCLGHALRWTGSSEPADLAAARAANAIACDGSVGPACFSLALQLFQGTGGPADPQTGRAAALEACDLGERAACAFLDDHPDGWSSPPPDVPSPFSSAEAFERAQVEACERGVQASCSTRARLEPDELRGSLEPGQVEAVFALLQQGCDAGSLPSCLALRNMTQAGLMACERVEGNPCIEAGFAYQNGVRLPLLAGPSLRRDSHAARTAFKVACHSGHPDLCDRAKDQPAEAPRHLRASRATRTKAGGTWRERVEVHAYPQRMDGLPAQGGADVHLKDEITLPVNLWGKACGQGDAGACKRFATSVQFSENDGSLLEEHEDDLDAACSKGIQDACALLAMHGMRDERAKLDVMVSRACKAGMAHACRHELIASFQGAGKSAFNAALVQKQARECESGRSVKCASAAQLYTIGLGVEKDPVRAGDLMARGCASGEPWSCHLHGERLAADGGQEQLAASRAANVIACDAWIAPACFDLAMQRFEGRGGAIDASGARASASRACELGSRPGCNLMALTNEGRVFPPSGSKPVFGSEADFERVLRKYCTLGGTETCAAAALRDGAPLPEEVKLEQMEPVLQLLQHGCDTGSLKSCTGLRNLVRTAFSACADHDLSECSLAGFVYSHGVRLPPEVGTSVPPDAKWALAAFKAACDGGQTGVCDRAISSATP